MTDKQWIAKVKKIKDAKEACRILVKHETYLGYDPYYSVLRNALIDMCERCGKEAT